MERFTSTPRINKTQRESHSEIERKRRERMKRDTEFLRKQIASPHCKDKLSIFQAGAERLIQYTDKLGKRDYILNDEEYSRIIMNNFDGFCIHIRCVDGKILEVHRNIEPILDLSVSDIVGRPIADLVEPSATTKQITNEVFHSSQLQWDMFDGLISRNFVLALRCGPKVAAHHCIYGSDGERYRFIEFCGDLSRDTTTTDVNGVTFRGLCRPLEPATGGSRNNGDCIDSAPNPRHFTLRLSPNEFRIIEVVGDVLDLLGCDVDQLLRQQLQDLCASQSRDSVTRMLNEVQQHSPVNGVVHLIHTKTGQPIPFDIRLSAIRLGSFFHCVVCQLHPHFQRFAEDFHQCAETNGSFRLNVCQTDTAAPAEFSHMESSDCTLRPNNIDEERCSNHLQPITYSEFDRHLPEQVEADASTREPFCPKFAQSTGSRSLYPDSDEWFKNVDTSSFQNLLNSDYLPSPDHC